MAIKSPIAIPMRVAKKAIKIVLYIPEANNLYLPSTINVLLKLFIKFSNFVMVPPAEKKAIITNYRL
ncbi:hypothetical protein DSECCO2_536180 [anaerobic digester metagenome]